MIKQWFIQQGKTARGIWWTYFNRGSNINKPYDANNWWNDRYYTTGVSDAKTIRQEQDEMSTAYHYSTIELLILRHFCNNGIVVKNKAIFDIGSGAGHWLNFYSSLGAKELTGVDIARAPYEFLSKKYKRTQKPFHNCKNYFKTGKNVYECSKNDEK